MPPLAEVSAMQLNALNLHEDDRSFFALWNAHICDARAGRLAPLPMRITDAVNLLDVCRSFCERHRTLLREALREPLLAHLQRLWLLGTLTRDDFYGCISLVDGTADVAASVAMPPPG